MPSSSLTSKGQITIPSDLRKKLHLQPGDKVTFEEKNGVITITPANDDLDAMAGCLANDTNRHATLDDMEQAIQRGITGKWNKKDNNNAGH